MHNRPRVTARFESRSLDSGRLGSGLFRIASVEPFSGSALGFDGLVRSAFLLFLFVLPALVGAQPNDFEKELSAAIVAHEEARTGTEQMAALAEFREVAERHSERWQAHYWLAFVGTQTSMFAGRPEQGLPEGVDPKELVRAARRDFDRAATLAEGADPRQRADLILLDHLVESFEARVIEGNREAGREALRAGNRQVAQLDPSNPQLAVAVAIDSISQGNDDYRHVLLALWAFETTNEWMKREERARGTYHSLDFLPFWTGRARELLKDQLAEE